MVICGLIRAGILASTPVYLSVPFEWVWMGLADSTAAIMHLFPPSPSRRQSSSVVSRPLAFISISSIDIIKVLVENNVNRLFGAEISK